MTRPRYDPPAPQGSRTQLLLVDDEPANLRLMEAYLEPEGFGLVSVVSGPAALAALEEGGIDLVLLDIRMPAMDGLEVCRRIRATPANARLPIIFLTAERSDPESELRGLEAGADEYLRKPIERRALLMRVRSLLRLADAERDRRLIAQLAQTEKLAAIGQIAAGVAHEINNPLSFMLSNLESLRGYLVDIREALAAFRRGGAEGEAAYRRLEIDRLLADVDPLLSETSEGANRVRSIVQQLKTFSRAEDPGLEAVDLADVASSVLVLTERELSLRARVVRQLEPALISAAPRASLHQVALNLVINAFQALGEGAAEANEIRIATGVRDGDAVLEVSDSGPGIPPELQERIFDPFFTTKPVGTGSGLGLSVCATVAQKLGGRIELQSEPGRGARFTLRIPVEPASAA